MRRPCVFLMTMRGVTGPLGNGELAVEAEYLIFSYVPFYVTPIRLKFAGHNVPAVRRVEQQGPSLNRTKGFFVFGVCVVKGYLDKICSRAMNVCNLAQLKAVSANKL